MNNMKSLYILLLAQISVQLKCDNTRIQATIGSTLTITCTYKANQYRFSKKYWCAGDSRSSCEVLMDTDGFTHAVYRTRAQIIDGASRGLTVYIRDLKLDDSGTYWVAIDKIYADFMIRIQVTITKEAVIKPNVWPLSSPEMTCWGQPSVFRCRSERGADVQYTWYRVGHPNNIVLHHSSDLYLHCSNITEDSQLFCSAFNDVSSQRSEFVSLHLLQSAEKDCVYRISSNAFSSYECIRSTTSLSTSIQTTEKFLSSTTVSHLTWSQNKTTSWSGLPMWYECLRWILSSVMITILCVVHSCSKYTSSKHPKDV
ncbi:uncharacterized protein LOC122328911 [Puntigrus tetrazona]|uniref:uncharacterized protein LOC122328911 n=1 Tax=Puntigrus tetrazona TaxID=1606681 RepID=UPI001C8A87A2|nr:uncharacterized protein LOC122328911 [Puntigrus tetrazona]XP_043080930.1 uncharacterized protein LOC122328911 [Puntigrus tetrazona]